MTLKPSITLVSLCAVALLLGGCADAKKDLGLVKTPPDEFSVLKRAPLAMPPEFTLRPPEPGAPRPQETPVAVQAKTDVLGAQPTTAPDDNLTKGEDALLQAANIPADNPQIRAVVDREAKTSTNSKTPVVKKLLNIGSDDKPAASVVDPVAETKRLKSNAAQGKPVTAGKTPSVTD